MPQLATLDAGHHTGHDSDIHGQRNPDADAGDCALLTVYHQPAASHVAVPAVALAVRAVDAADPPRGFGLAPFVDVQGHQVPFRSCVGADAYLAPGTGAMRFDTLTIPVVPGGDPANAIRDFADYTTYNHSTFGHLNADGLAFVDRQYPSPP